MSLRKRLGNDLPVSFTHNLDACEQWMQVVRAIRFRSMGLLQYISNFIEIDAYPVEILTTVRLKVEQNQLVSVASRFILGLIGLQGA